MNASPFSHWIVLPPLDRTKGTRKPPGSYDISVQTQEEPHLLDARVGRLFQSPTLAHVTVVDTKIIHIVGEYYTSKRSCLVVW